MKKIICLLTIVMLCLCVNVSAKTPRTITVDGEIYVWVCHTDSMAAYDDPSYFAKVEIIRALGLAIKYLAPEPDYSNLAISGSGNYGFYTHTPYRTPAEKKRDKAKEVLTNAEKEAEALREDADAIEQKEKDIKFIEKVLKNLKGE